MLLGNEKPRRCLVLRHKWVLSRSKGPTVTWMAAIKHEEKIKKSVPGKMKLRFFLKKYLLLLLFFKNLIQRYRNVLGPRWTQWEEGKFSKCNILSLLIYCPYWYLLALIFFTSFAKPFPLSKSWILADCPQARNKEFLFLNGWFILKAFIGSSRQNKGGRCWKKKRYSKVLEESP